MKGKPYPGVTGEDLTLAKQDTSSGAAEYSQVTAKTTGNSTGSGTKAGSDTK